MLQNVFLLPNLFPLHRQALYTEKSTEKRVITISYINVKASLSELILTVIIISVK